MKKLFRVNYDTTPFRPKTIQMKLFLWSVQEAIFYYWSFIKSQIKTFIRPFRIIGKNKTYLIAL